MQNTVKTRNGLTLIVPDAAEDENITRAALSDPDAQPLTDAQIKYLRPTRLRGRPVGTGKKMQLTLRIDTEVIDYFKQSGEGWQTRMNDVLREWVARR
ncbi:MAG: BrnA antitoxin family protein [Burkholderiales bacterium]|jgi:uncharacterized protein (DUF4415 family)|nr:BrnA antitoxin family protein [Burkholderiales bacterium]